MSLDEASAAFVAQIAASGTKPLNEMTPAEARGLGGMLTSLSGPGPDVERIDEHCADPGGGEPVALRAYVPAGTPRGVVAYFHGGGWVMGSVAEFDTVARILAVRTGCVVVLVDYRLAPEHPYPAAVVDAWTALLWIDAHLEHIAGSRVPLIVAGDSAGGNLAAVLAQRAERDGGPAIALQVLIYPVTDSDTETDSYTDPENQLLLSREAMLWYFGHYAPDAADRGNLDIAPLRATELGGLPPAVVLTAEHDPLRDEGEAYAIKLADAGVPVTHRRFVGQMHGFFTMIDIVPGSARAVDFVVEEIDSALNTMSTSPNLPRSPR